MTERRNKASQYYLVDLVDKRFCEMMQRRIVIMMGKPASMKNFNKEGNEILNELVDIWNFFQRKELRTYSDRPTDSIDVEDFF